MALERTGRAIVKCATHPNVETELACGRCGKPICPRCLVYTPVGARCRDCAQLRRLPTYQVPASYILRGIGAAGAGTIAEKPETAGNIILLVAIPETMVILGFVIAIVIVFTL